MLRPTSILSQKGINEKGHTQKSDGAGGGEVRKLFFQFGNIHLSYEVLQKELLHNWKACFVLFFDCLT